MRLIRIFVARLTGSMRADVLFPLRQTVHFRPEIKECSLCDSALHVQKTDTKSLVTMDIGAFWAKQTVLYCPHDQKTFSSEELQSLVPKGGTFGFDVIVYVGFSLFVHCRNNQETMACLAAKNVFILRRKSIQTSTILTGSLKAFKTAACSQVTSNTFPLFLHMP